MKITLILLMPFIVLILLLIIFLIISILLIPPLGTKNIKRVEKIYN